MTRLLAIAVLLSVGTASAEVTPPAPSPAETNLPAPAGVPDRPMVRNIGIAEQGDAIIVRNRRMEAEPKTELKTELKAEPAPATRPVQK